MSTMSKTDANISENKNNILITLLASICSLGPLATDMYLPALPQMTLDFATTPSIIQLTPVASGRFTIVLSRGASASCVQAAQEVLNGNVTINALYFHVYRSGIDTYGTVIGDHIFY